MHKLVATTLVLLAFSCGTSSPEATEDNTPSSPERPGTSDPRDAWQRPDELFAMIGPDIKGATVADLFAGDGYFTFKLIEAGANVIAIDNDPANVALLEERKRQAGLGDDRLRIRAVPVGDPGLSVGEVDIALLTHRYTSIRDRGSYIKRLRQGLRPPRPLFLIEWQFRETPIGPPMEQRMPTDDIMEELGVWGYTDIGAHSAKMPHQVIFFATDHIEMTDEEYERMMQDVEVTPL